MKTLKSFIYTTFLIGAIALIFPLCAKAGYSSLAGATAALVNIDESVSLADSSPLSGINYIIMEAVTHPVSIAVDDEVNPIIVELFEVEDPRDNIDYDNTAVAKVNDFVNVREAPSEDSPVVGKLYSNCVGTVIDVENGWVHIKSGSVEGYVRGDYVVVGDEELIDSVATYRATITADALKMRSEMSTDSKVYDVARNGEKLEILDDENYLDGWLKVHRGDTEAYVAAEYVDISYEFDYAESKAEEEARLKREAEKRALLSYNRGVEVCNYALQFVGNPYVWGGTSLTKGADCSGFVMSVYKKYGISLPHSSYADRRVGRGVDVSDMRPGDLVCYSGHVALYIGGGQIVHAASKRSGIKVSSAYYRKILAVRRVL